MAQHHHHELPTLPTAENTTTERLNMLRHQFTGGLSPPHGRGTSHIHLGFHELRAETCLS